MVQGLVRLILLAVLLLSGCTVTPTQTPTQTPTPSPSPQPAEEAEPVTANTELQGSPAMSLLSRAEQARAQGQTGAASRYLERALTMAPDSSWLYRELALLRLEEGDGHAAEGFAQRALRLAPDNDAYRAELWELVAAARAEQGDRSGADDARSRAQALRRPQRA